MRPIRNPDVIARMQTTFELCEMAEAMMRQNLRRRYPDETAAQIEHRVMAWLQDRPGAEYGDAAGPVRLRRVFE